MKSMLNKIKAVIFISISFCVLFTAVPSVLAFDFENDSGLAETNDYTGYTEAGFETRTLPEIIGMIIQVILGFLGVFFLLLSIYAGFRWMLSRGNSQEVEIAKKTLQNALIGLVIVVIAYAVTFLIMNSLSTIQTT